MQDQLHYEYKPEFIVDEYNPLTLHQTMLVKAKHLGEQEKEDFVNLLSTIARSCKLINYQLRQAGLNNLYGDVENDKGNASGETRKKIDVISNDILKQQLCHLSTVSAIASEEEDDIFNAKDDGKYLIAFDPLDGSSNIDCNVTVGTIFAIWKKDPATGKATQQDFFRTGRELLASGYCVYGNATLFVIAFNGEVNGFTQADNIGDFILTHPKITTKETFNVYSINEGNQKKWHQATAEYVKDKKAPKTGKVYSLRYIGSMVGDVHRTLLYGGIFMYPADNSSPNGKLRVLYECIPLAYVLECSGGMASDGYINMLDLKPTKIHQRTSIVLGSKKDVEEYIEYVKNFAPQQQ